MALVARVSALVLAASILGSALAGTATPQVSPPSQPDSVARGELVSVGSHRLYCECRGSGEPVIVL